MKRSLVLLALVSCTSSAHKSSTSSGADYSVICTDVCATGVRLGCDFAKPTPAGASCEEVCNKEQALYHRDLTCRAEAQSCPEIDRCK